MELFLPPEAAGCFYGLLWIDGDMPPYHDFIYRGFVDRIWILDVEGERVVINAFHGPRVTDEEVDELTRIVESVAFANTDQPQQ